MNRRRRQLFIIGLILICFLFLSYLLFLVETTEGKANIGSYSDAIWYGIVTLTTVGYGDFFPVSTLGKFIGGLFIFGSLGILGYLIGEISNYINTYMEKRRTGYFGTPFEDHFVIIGWNNFARQVANQIYYSGKKLAIVTNSEEKLRSIKSLYPEKNVFVLLSDFDDYKGYEKVNLEKARSAFVNIGDDTATLVFLLNLRKQYKETKFVVSLENADLKETYRSIGVSCALAKNDVASRLVASYIFEPDVATFTEDLISTSLESDDCDILQFIVKSDNPYKDSTYMNTFVDLKKKYNGVLIGLSRPVDGGERVLIKNPHEDLIIHENDYIIVISDKTGKEKMMKALLVNEGE